MKVLHTADWHLGKRLEKFSRFEEQIQVLEEVIAIADREAVDVILVAGDLFDHFNPATEAVELLYKTLKRLSHNGERVVLAIAGNHDSPDRIEAPDALAKSCGILFAGYPHTEIGLYNFDSDIKITRSAPGFIELQFPQYSYPLRIIYTPYANEYRLKTFLGLADAEENLRDVLQQHWQQLADTYCDNQGVNILMAHLYMMQRGGDMPQEPEDEKPILHVGAAQAVFTENVPPQMQYVALGHLHRFQQITKEPCPMVYSSSLLSYSFSEAGQQKYVVLLNLSPATKAEYLKIPLKAGKLLQRKKFNDIELALEWLKANPDTLVELTLVSDTYLKSDDKRRLMQSHQGIVMLIPELLPQTDNEAEMSQKTHIDLSQEMDSLFSQYFKHKHNGISPNAEILDLFKELLAEK